MSNFVKWNCIGMILTFFISISVPQTCSDYKSRTKSNSGYFLIDPEQKKGGTTKFVVFCDFENGKSFWLFSIILIWHIWVRDMPDWINHIVIIESQGEPSK